MFCSTNRRGHAPPGLCRPRFALNRLWARPEGPWLACPSCGWTGSAIFGSPPHTAHSAQFFCRKLHPTPCSSVKSYNPVRGQQGADDLGVPCWDAHMRAARTIPSARLHVRPRPMGVHRARRWANENDLTRHPGITERLASGSRCGGDPFCTTLPLTPMRKGGKITQMHVEMWCMLSCPIGESAHGSC